MSLNSKLIIKSSGLSAACKPAITFACICLMSFVAQGQSSGPNITPNTWVIVHPTYLGVPNGGQIWPSGWGNKGAYDPATQRVIISDRWYDSVHGVSIFANNLSAYDVVLNDFDILKLNNWYAKPTPAGGWTTTALPANATDPTPPDHHPLSLFEVVPEQNAVYTVNGVNSISLPDPSILDRVWRFDLGTKSWTMVSSALSDLNYPPNNVGAPSGLIYDTVAKKLAYFNVSLCGCSGTSTYLFDPAVNVWTAVPQDTSSAKVQIGGAGVTYDSKRHLAMAFGGNTNIVIAPTAHLWSYSVALNRWQQLKDAPAAAMAPGFAYDSKHDIFLALVGGDTYVYDPNANTWTELSAKLNRPPASPQNWQGITYDPAHDVFVFEGGNWSNPLMALFRYDPSGHTGKTPPSVAITQPANGSTVSGTATVTASASSSVGISFLQFSVDGVNLGAPITSSPYSESWNTAGVANGVHSLSVTAFDTIGLTATSTISVSVHNSVSSPLAISSVSAQSITSSGAKIIWSTNNPASSGVSYGLTAAYGSASALSSTPVTSHSVLLSGLKPATQYHFQVISEDGSGNTVKSSDETFTTSASPAMPFLLNGNHTEVSGVSSGSAVVPAVMPDGLSGRVVSNGSGGVQFSSAVDGNGVYFLGCCANKNNAYYKFGGTPVGALFNTSQGQVSFDLTSRYTFAQRNSLAYGQRFAFDVRDGGSDNHLFYFRTQVMSGYLQFSYLVSGKAFFYYVPRGTEDSIFGNGVTLHVSIQWKNNSAQLYLNGSLVSSGSYTPSTANWTSASNFDIGAYEYATFGGYNASDDIISEFSVTTNP